MDVQQVGWAVRGIQIWLFRPGYAAHTHLHTHAQPHISDSRSPEGLCGCVNEACSGRSLFTWSSCLFWSCLHLTGSASGFVPVKLPLTRPLIPLCLFPGWPFPLLSPLVTLHFLFLLCRLWPVIFRCVTWWCFGEFDFYLKVDGRLMCNL